MSIYPKQQTKTLGEIADFLGASLTASRDLPITGLAPLDRATSSEISFLDNIRYRPQLKSTSAAAVLLHSRYRDECPVQALLVEQPYVAYAKLTQLFATPVDFKPGLHPTCVVGEGAQIHPSASVGPYCVIGKEVLIGPQVRLDPHCMVGDQSTIGAGTHCYAGVKIYHQIQIGERCILHCGAVIGSDGFGYAETHEGWIKIEQLGGVSIGHDVEIGANTTIDRGALLSTVIENGVKIDNQVQIAHNVFIGEHTAIAGCTGIAGSTRIGKRCKIGGAVAVSGHLQICDQTMLTGVTAVSKSITEPGVYSSGFPAQENTLWRKMIAQLRQLGAFYQKIQALQERVSKLENQSESKG